MWQYHDSKLKELKKTYNKVSKQTQNRLQEIFDGFNITFDTLYNIADTKSKRKIDTYIEEWKDKGILEGYFGMLANNIYRRTRVKNSEILELLIYSAYIEEQNKLQETELNTFKDVANYYYQQGQKEVNKKKKASVIPDAIFLALLAMPNVKGWTYDMYIQTMLKYNADQIYRQALINLQQQKELEIDSGVFQNIIKKQQNTRLTVNGNKISGDIDLTLIGINNMAKVEGIAREDDNAKVMFLANIDGKETEMCHSLNNQKFYINKENEFDRYYGETQKDLTIRRIKCKGLVLGLNLPPISHHFHWCRSTIQYIPTVEKTKKIEYNIDNFLRTELYDDKDYDEYISDYEKVRNEYEKLPETVKDRLFNREKVKVVFNYKGEDSGYNYKTKEILLKAGVTDGEFIHEVGHALEYSMDLRKKEEYIEISNKLFEHSYKEAKYDKYKIYYGLNNEEKFVSPYQSYLGTEYNEIIKNYNNKFLRELISEGYRDIYSVKNPKDSKLYKINKDLYNFIREIERNA